MSEKFRCFGFVNDGDLRACVHKRLCDTSSYTLCSAGDYGGFIFVIKSYIAHWFTPFLAPILFPAPAL